MVGAVHFDFSSTSDRGCVSARSMPRIDRPTGLVAPRRIARAQTPPRTRFTAAVALRAGIFLYYASDSVEMIPCQPGLRYRHSGDARIHFDVYSGLTAPRVALADTGPLTIQP